MIIEFPESEKCCFCVDLRFGVGIVIIIRVVFVVLIILGLDPILLRGLLREDQSMSRRDWDWNWPSECYNLYHQDDVELVILVVVAIMFILWLIVMIPAVLWEMLILILVGGILEILVWLWFFWIFCYTVTLTLLREHPSVLVLWTGFLLVMELYILWIMWSYYVDVKLDYDRPSVDDDDDDDDRRDSEVV